MLSSIRFTRLFSPRLAAGAALGTVLTLAGCESKQITTEAAQSTPPQAELTPAQLTVLTAGDPNAPADLRRDAYLAIAGSNVAGEPIYLDFYRATLAEGRTDPTVASICAAALARYGEPADIAAITPLLDSDEPFVRWQAAVALQRLHNPAAASALIQTVLNDLDADTRQAAAFALGQYPRRDVYDALLTALDDRDYGVSLTAQETLTLLTNHHEAGDDPRAWLDHANANPATLFDDAQPYTYTNYPPSRNFVEVLLFQPLPDAEPQTPRGYQPPT